LREAFNKVAPIRRGLEVTRTLTEPQVELLKLGTLKKRSEIKVNRIIDKHLTI